MCLGKINILRNQKIKEIFAGRRQDDYVIKIIKKFAGPMITMTKFLLTFIVDFSEFYMFWLFVVVYVYLFITISSFFFLKTPPFPLTSTYFRNQWQIVGRIP